ncbi:MAG: nucleoside triphosphate pyrophosphohydrolase family protein [Lachnospiraceae bacterium]|nr:nucleoside triphosphate pyrophosphohydrolase family protein [Lachnospiraceae bacterium]
MELNDYQKAALSTAIYPNDGKISYLALAICGEAGEAADKVKKVLRDKQGQFYNADLTAIALELGDILWYIANLASVLGFSLSDIATLNIDKINGRVERGTLHGTGDNR